MRFPILALGFSLTLFLIARPSHAQSAARATSVGGWLAEVDEALSRDDRRRAIEILDQKLDESPSLLEARLLRARVYSANAEKSFFEASNASILDPSDLRQIAQAAARVARGAEWGFEYNVEHDISRAILDFEFILARDSSFENTLYEYSKLWHSHYVFDRAIEAGEAQVRLRPDVAAGHEELVASYRHYIWRRKSERALRWLEERPTPYARYFVGEIYRREGRYKRADDIYANLLNEDAAIPRPPVILSRARVRIAQGRHREAYSYIEQALQFDSLVGARLLLGEFLYVMDATEHADSRQLGTVDEYRAFVEKMWTRRNPAPAAAINWRLLEHFRRLVVAERDFEFFGSRKRPMGDVVTATDVVPAYEMDIDVPSWYYDVHGLNDKGLIYVRYGEPDQKLWTQPVFAPPPDPGVPLNTSWRYAAEKLDFHFVNPHTGGEPYAYYLVASLGECRMAADRAQWGGFYQQLAPHMRAGDPRKPIGGSDPCDGDADPRSVFDAAEAVDKLSDAGREAINRGLATDRHTWSTMEVESFDFPFDVVTFRGNEGRTDVSVYFALPVGWFSGKVSSDELPVAVGFAMHDMNWQAVARESAVRRYPISEEAAKAAFEEIHLSVRPDSYRVSIHADLLDEPPLGGYKMGLRIPDYTRLEAMMSDVVLAYDVRPKAGHVPSSRSSLQITANPFHRSALDQSLHVYFELYNLTLDQDDRARYRVRYALEPTKKEGGVFGLFGRKQPGLSVSASFEDDTPSPIVYSEIDVGELSVGEYEFTVHVTDETSGKELARRVRVELYQPNP